MIYKFTGSLLFLLGVGLFVQFAGFDYQESSSLATNSSSAKLYKEWSKDLRKLRKKKQLPKGFDSIKEVQYTPLSKMSAQWLSNLKVPVKVNYQGKYRLNLEIDHWAEKNKAAAVVHYQLIHIGSGNTVWEFGRTYPIR